MLFRRGFECMFVMALHDSSGIREGILELGGSKCQRITVVGRGSNIIIW